MNLSLFPCFNTNLPWVVNFSLDLRTGLSWASIRELYQRPRNSIRDSIVILDQYWPSIGILVVWRTFWLSATITPRFGQRRPETIAWSRQEGNDPFQIGFIFLRRRAPFWNRIFHLLRNAFSNWRLSYWRRLWNNRSEPIALLLHLLFLSFSFLLYWVF